MYAQSALLIRRNGVKLNNNTYLWYVRTRCAQISWRHRLILTVKHICLEIKIICIVNDEGDNEGIWLVAIRRESTSIFFNDKKEKKVIIVFYDQLTRRTDLDLIIFFVKKKKKDKRKTA